MAALNAHWLRPTAGALLVAALSSACGLTSTRIDYVDTDTYLSSQDASNHSELTTLRVSNSGGTEERALLKLPTGARDLDTNLFEAFKSPENLLLAPFFILLETFAAFFNCKGKVLAPILLSDSRLVFDVTQNDTGASLASQIQLQLVDKPWWQTASWGQAHGFSKTGTWSSGGGDPDATFTPVQAVAGSGGATIEFDVTSYVRGLLGTEKAHYGILLRSSGASLGSVALASTQFSNTLQRPRLVSTYNCITPTGNLQASADAQPYTYILGQ